MDPPSPNGAEPVPVGAVKAGTNVTISPDGTISASGGGGGGSIDLLAEGKGITIVNPSGPTATIANAGVTSLTAGSNITLSASTGDITISASGGGGGGDITSLQEGEGITITDAAGPVPVISNSGVTGIVAGQNISVDQTTGLVTVSATSTAPITSLAEGTGISITSPSGPTPVIENTGVTQIVAGDNITIDQSTGSVRISASGGGGGVTSVTGQGAGISVNPTSGDVVVQNTGVTKLTGGRGIQLSASTGDISVTIPDEAVEVFPSQRFLMTDVKELGGNGDQGGQSTRYGSINVNYPAGANRASVVWRMATISNWSGEGTGGSFQICNVRGAQWVVNLSNASFEGGGGSGASSGENLAGAGGSGVTRSQSQFLVRTDVLRFGNGTSAGTFTINVDVSQSSSTRCKTQFSSFQVLLFPYASR